jgi:AcrR family transcriptional regulator
MPETTSPLTAVVSSLKEAQRRGELSSAELSWSLAALTRRRGRATTRTEGADRTDEILDAAAWVFRRRGFHRTTIEGIGTQLKLTKAGVYHYFASKQEILEAICERAIAQIESDMAAALRQPGDPLVQLKGAIECYAEILIRQDSAAVLMRHFDEQSEIVKRGQTKRRKAIELTLRQKLEEGVEQGVFDGGDTRVTGLAMVGALNWIFSWYERDGRLSAEAVREALVSLLLDGVLARPPD